MNIAMIGAGNVATALGKFWSANGHKLFFSYSRDANKLQRTAASVHPDAKSGPPAEAVAFADVVVLAVPFAALDDAIRACGSLSGKLVLSCINALKPDNSGLAIGTTTSAAEEVAKRAPGARVVEGLPAFAEVLHSPSQKIGGHIPSIFVCGNDAEAKQTVAALLGETGVEVVDAGPLWAARYVEPAMFLLVDLAYVQGWVRVLVSSSYMMRLSQNMSKQQPEHAGDAEREDLLSAADSRIPTALPSQDTKSAIAPSRFHVRIQQDQFKIDVSIWFDAASYKQVLCSVSANSVALFGLSGSKSSDADGPFVKLLDILRFDTPIDPSLTLAMITESLLVLSLTKYR